MWRLSALALVLALGGSWVSAESAWAQGGWFQELPPVPTRTYPPHVYHGNDNPENVYPESGYTQPPATIDYGQTPGFGPEFYEEFQQNALGRPYRYGRETSRLEGAPEIPEPMVFDMIRPLHARRGEQEVNVLAMFPLSRMQRVRLPETDPFGLAPLSVDRRGVEWAPEYEVALADGFGVEFELPFEDAVLEAYKFAAQYTIGTAFDNQYIHGFQTIIEPDTRFQAWDLTLLYMGGLRFDEVWSVMAMFGGRSAAGAPQFDNRTEMLLNFAIFADLDDRVTLGLEVNQARNMRGRGTMLVTPQLHWLVTERIEWQSGFGVGFLPEDSIASFVTRVIYIF